MEAIWIKVKAAIKERVPRHSFDMWIEPLGFSQDEQGTWTLSCPNCFYKKRVRDLYAEIIASELRKTTGEDGQLSFVVSGRDEDSKPKGEYHPQLVLPGEMLRPHGGRLLRKDFTFDHFVVGGNNDFAYSASLSLASKKDAQQHSLFLLAKTGMGKSHLAQAIGHHVLSAYPSERVYYITAEDFSNEMVQAYRHDAIDKFKGKYRNHCDVLLLEDVHYLSGKERTQIELALTLDFLFETGKRIIFSSCCLPAEIPKLNDELRSRLSSGLVSMIDPPNFRTRVRILQKKATTNGYKIPPEVLQYLAEALTDDVRQLEGGLNGVAAKSALLGIDIDLKLAESVVKTIVRQRQSITIDVIKKLVCKYYKISPVDIVSRSRKQSHVRPRHIAIYLSRRYTDSPLQTIGKSFNRYHATAMHAINCIERGLKEDSAIQRQVQFFQQKLETGKF
ncbi:MAG: chromosomal replication initiator protein DnaA [Desulfobacterales bacterium]|nr:MAG: chromosomal replication initiator protein DnaA [Desulfobacterales bacterium]